MIKNNILSDIENKRTSLGIEFGSTRIKAVLIDSENNVISSGSFEWENQFVENKWIYYETEIWKGLQSAYSELKNNVHSLYGIKLSSIGNIGISGMMHGLIALDNKKELLTNFRTWRNNYSEQASKILSEAFKFNIPERWSVSQLFQSIMDKEDFISKLKFITTLSGYIHFKLTNEFVIGIGDASGMFPVNHQARTYNEEFVKIFNQIVSGYTDDGFDLISILPKVQEAGNNAGNLTNKGASLLDPEGDLETGIPFCPPEGDTSTGMIATNSIKKGNTNISVGTSIFSMTVLENYLENYHEEIDLVVTPDSKPVAMIHANNCSTELNEWMSLFEETLKAFGISKSKNEIFSTILYKALEGDKNTGNLLAYSYYSGENLTKIENGVPLFLRLPNSEMSLPNVVQMLLFSAFSTLKIGIDILLSENILFNRTIAHGGIFKTEKIAQVFLSSVLDLPISVYEGADEGGAWGMAVLASKINYPSLSLEDYLEKMVFNNKKLTIEDVDGEINNKFQLYFERFHYFLNLESQASLMLKNLRGDE